MMRRSTSPRQQGFVLVTGLLFLVIMTMLGLALFRGTGLMDRISANTRDKQRAFESAQAALQYGEFWLSQQGGTINTSACNSLTSGDPASVANVHICSNALASTYASLPWAAGFTYTPPGMNVVAGGGLATSGVDVTYSALPGFYIEYLGLAADGSSKLYQVTAYGYGGSANSVAVVRSTYAYTTSGTPDSANGVTVLGS